MSPQAPGSSSIVLRFPQFPQVMAPKQHADLTHLDLETSDMEFEGIQGDTGGCFDEPDFKDPETLATFEVMHEETSKMCIVAAAWEFPQNNFTKPLAEERDEWNIQAGIFQSKLDGLAAGYGQHAVDKPKLEFEPLLDQFNRLNETVKSINETDRLSKIPKRLASDAPSPEISGDKACSSSARSSSDVPSVHKARKILFPEEPPVGQEADVPGAPEDLETQKL